MVPEPIKQGSAPAAVSGESQTVVTLVCEMLR